MNKAQKRSRIGQLIDDIFAVGSVDQNSTNDWPHPDYARAATACARNDAALEKLRQLAEDLECCINLAPGPGSLPRLARVSRVELKTLSGRSWREVLTDADLSPRVWAALRNLSKTLNSEEMDDASRRMGIVIHVVAIARLEAVGEVEADAKKRKRHQAERQFVIAQPYVPLFICKILDNNSI